MPNSSPSPSAAQLKKGTLYAAAAYALWGLFPIYWKWLKAFPPLEILSHRILWAFLFYSFLLYRKGDRPASWVQLLSQRTTLPPIAAASILLTSNWLLYIWAVNTGHVLEASLGYFITPLLNVLMGRMVLGESLSRLRWVAVGLAASGVLLLALQAGHFPWIALTLAGTFATYGLIRKQIKTDVLHASCAETSLVTLPALAALLYFRLFSPTSPAAGGTDWMLFVGSGVVTGLPLIWFAHGARLLPLSTLGFFQYIAPTLQFALGLFVYGEPFSIIQFRAFLLIWIGLAVFSWESFRKRR